MALARVLVVDDNEGIRLSLCAILEKHDFEVTCAADVSEALKFISLHKYDVLLSDLHMPGAGDGLTVVSAMRHANPEAVTLLLSVSRDVRRRQRDPDANGRDSGEADECPRPHRRDHAAAG